MQTTIQQEGDVLVVQYDGPLAFRARAEAVDRVVPLIREQGIRRLLIDFTGAWPSREKAAAAEAFASRLVTIRALKGTAVAFLNPPHGHVAPAELVAPIVGFKVQRFFNRQLAMEWLARAA